MTSRHPKTHDADNHKVVDADMPTPLTAEDTNLRLRAMELAVELTSSKGGVDTIVQAQKIYDWIVADPRPDTLTPITN